MIQYYRRYAAVKAEIAILEADIELSIEERKRSFSRFHDFSTGLTQFDKTQNHINRMTEQLEIKKRFVERADEALSKLNGIEFQIARLKYIEGKGLAEVADELGYSYDHIRRLHSKMIRQYHNDATDMLETS